MMKRISLFSFTICMVFSTAQAQTAELGGVIVDAPIAFASCWDDGVSGTCIRESNIFVSMGKVWVQRVDIVFAENAKPHGMWGNTGSVLMDGSDRVMRFEYSTQGLRAQQEVLDILTEKWGRPSWQETAGEGNADGAALGSVVAKWSLRNGRTASFIGAFASNGFGQVRLSSGQLQ